MYKLVHVPTGKNLGEFDTVNSMFDWLKNNPGYDKADLVVREYHFIKESKLA